MRDITREKEREHERQRRKKDNHAALEALRWVELHTETLAEAYAYMRDIQRKENHAAFHFFALIVTTKPFHTPAPE